MRRSHSLSLEWPSEIKTYYIFHTCCLGEAVLMNAIDLFILWGGDLHWVMHFEHNKTNY